MPSPAFYLREHPGNLESSGFRVLSTEKHIRENCSREPFGPLSTLLDIPLGSDLILRTDLKGSDMSHEGEKTERVQYGKVGS